MFQLSTNIKTLFTHSTWPPSTFRLFSFSAPKHTLPKDPSKRRKAMDRANQLVRDRRHSDLNYRIKENTNIFRRLLKKSQENPDFRAKRIQTGKDWYAQHAHAESRTRLKICLRDWCIRLFDLFEHLPWKTHSPLLFPERQEHTCATCKYKRLYGMRLWWASHEDGRLTCHNCYVKTREQAMPKGYEDVKTLTDLRARKKELEGPSPGNK